MRTHIDLEGNVVITAESNAEYVVVKAAIDKQAFVLEEGVKIPSPIIPPPHHTPGLFDTGPMIRKPYEVTC